MNLFDYECNSMPDGQANDTFSVFIYYTYIHFIFIKILLYKDFIKLK